MKAEEYKKLIEKVKDKDCSNGCERCGLRIACSRIHLLEKLGYKPYYN